MQGVFYALIVQCQIRHFHRVHDDHNSWSVVREMLAFVFQSREYNMASEHLLSLQNTYRQQFIS